MPESGSMQHDPTPRLPTRPCGCIRWGMVEEPEFDVLLASSGGRGLDLFRAIRSVTGLSAWRSKQLLEAAPTTLVDRTWFEAAVDAARCLNAVGARADLVCRWCERVISPEDCPIAPEPCSPPFLSPTGCPASRPRA
ncbi:ribosomal protein L7/L12 [Streptomyces umbrinus]|uniref:ribosomal protein L7/L12 n=1 Tax=Streptomyces umbrinus TaxID=67370 RepID=UPI003C2BC2AF